MVPLFFLLLGTKTNRWNYFFFFLCAEHHLGKPLKLLMPFIKHICFKDCTHTDVFFV